MARKFTPEWWRSQRPEVVGKETEKIVESFLKERNTSQTFAWHRFPDAKAARGAMAAQPADYLVVSAGRCFLLEVKALKHAYRLPKDRVSQLPTLHKFDMAGSGTLILVHHYTEGVWRLVSAAELEIGLPSWDLREYPVFNNIFEAMEGAL